MKYFHLFVTVVGIIMSFGYYPQAYKIWKSKSSSQISLLSYLILTVGTTTWLVYGIVLKDFTIISGFTFGFIGSWLVLILAITYRKK